MIGMRLKNFRKLKSYLVVTRFAIYSYKLHLSVKWDPESFYFKQDFVQACLQFGNREQALKYIPKVKEELKIKYYVQAK